MARRSRRGQSHDELFAADDEAADTSGDDFEGPSRTARKKASLSLTRLGEQLVDAPKRVLDGLTLPEELMDDILEARSIKSFGARRRQTQLVGKRMRQLDDETVAAIRAALDSAGL